MSNVLEPAVPVLAHAGGIDEMLYILVPLLVFLGLQWLSRRKGARRDDAAVVDQADDLAKLERRRRLAGGLIGPPAGDQDGPDGRPSG
jgi:hypothetical protein